MPKKSALQYAKWINKFSGNQGLPQGMYSVKVVGPFILLSVA